MAAAFTLELMRRVVNSLDNFFPGNFEPRRIAQPDRTSLPPRDRRRRLNGEGFVYYTDAKASALRVTRKISPFADDLEATYAAFENDASRKMMIDYFAYRMLGPDRIRLPTPTPDYSEQLDRLDAIAEPAPHLTVASPGGMQALKRYDLSEWDLPIVVHARTLGVYNIFLVPQYAYCEGPHHLSARPGNTVLDLGSSYGDTALYFAHCVGPNGRVFAFEFLPSSLEKMQGNFASNPDLAPRIEPVRRAAWHASGTPMYFCDKGTATRVEPEPSETCTETAETLAVDDLVETRGLTVDFIKMDIEGAEIAALRGAERTLCRDRPTLALSAYHKLDDLAVLPRFLRELDLGYRFFLRNTTIFANELVFFATARPAG